MDIQFLISIDMCREAIEKLNSRREQAAEKLRQLDAGHQRRLLDYLQDRISDNQLDEVLSERSRLAALTQEDHSAVLEAIAQRTETLRLAAIRQANLLASYQSRCEFAEVYNGILQGVDGCDVKTLNHLQEICPGDLNTSDWWRFKTHLGEYDCLPAPKRKPYGQHCRCPEYVPSPLEK